MRRIARTFISGLIAALPLIITLAVTAWFLNFVWAYIGPQSKFGQLLVSVGIGVTASSVMAYLVGLALVIVAIFLLGLLVETRLTRWFPAFFDQIVQRIPLVSNVYGLSKRFTSIVDRKGDDSLASMSSVWCFFGGEPGAAVLALLPSAKPVVIGDKEYLGILVPSAPVPFGGALVYVPASWIRPAEGGVEHLMSVYVSMGVTPPRNSVG
jgi:uncharacterized membrane protein